MWKRPFILFAFLILTAPAAMAQPVPDNDALPDMRDASRQQVLQAITGKLPVQEVIVSGDAVLFDLDLSTFSGDIVGALARALTTGTGNTAVINQQGDNNTARIDQQGQRNVAVMVQRGSFNTSTLLQEGSYNVYGSLLDGSNNALDVRQIGNNHGYFLGFQGDNLDHTVMQDGNNNMAVQVGVNYQPFGIQQIGNNMDITIRHNGAQ